MIQSVECGRASLKLNVWGSWGKLTREAAGSLEVAADGRASSAGCGAHHGVELGGDELGGHCDGVWLMDLGWRGDGFDGVVDGGGWWSEEKRSEELRGGENFSNAGGAGKVRQTREIHRPAQLALHGRLERAPW